MTEESTDAVFVPLAPSLGFITNIADIDNDSHAAYGQGTYHINDRWRMTGGLRDTDEEKSYFNAQISVVPALGMHTGISGDTGSHAIEVNIPNQFEQIRIRRHQDGAITSFEEMPQS